MLRQANPCTERRKVTASSSVLIQSLQRLLGPSRCLNDAATRAVYARDASHLTAGTPLAVVLPRDDAELAAVVRICAAHATPFVARGSGTGLSGGAVPVEGAVVIACNRLDTCAEVDADRRRIRVGVGVLNEQVSVLATRYGLHFAPDPSSQSAATIGGNIAENAGGPHCLKVGVTLHHLLRLEWLDASGRSWTTGRGLALERGIDLVGLLTGSEGTLGLVAAADLKLTPNPAVVTTLLAFFPRLDEATRAVVDLLGAGLMPDAVEMVDQTVLRVVEQAFGFGFPTDVQAAMIVELAGDGQSVAEESERAERLLLDAGARQVRQAADENERAELWKCRKQAFGAVGRLSPCYVSMDVVVPLGRLPDLVDTIGDIGREFEVAIATAFHAGDGNLHPGVMYDDRDTEQTRRAYAAADRIIEEALARGGSVTGEHGVGLEKIHVIGKQLDATSAALMAGVKRGFDPLDLCNPGKLLPADEIEYTGGRPPPDEMKFQWDSLTVSAPADVSFAQLQHTALQRGFWIPAGVPLIETIDGTAATVGQLVASLLPGPSALGTGSARDFLLEIWAETGDGRTFQAGAPVFKNVAGYDLVHLLCGSGELLVRWRAATFQLKPAPQRLCWWRLRAASSRLAVLDELALMLTDWREDRTAPTCLAQESETGSDVVILAAGRDRRWDLDRKDQAIRRWAAPHGFSVVDQDCPPMDEVVQLCSTGLVPDWIRQGADWTLLCAHATGPSNPIPPGLQRFVWQAAPGLTWAPSLPSGCPTGWHADTVVQHARLTDPPSPDPRVPRWALAELKKLFDPHKRLATPAWLDSTPGGDRRG